MRIALGRLALAAALIFGAVTLASYLGDFWWGFDLATHFRPQLALAGMVAALAASVAVARIPAALLLAAALANAAPLLPRVSGATALDCASPRGLRFLTLNLHGRGTDPAAFRELIADERPDVVLLTEMPRDLAPLTDGPASALPGYRLVDRRGSGFDLALFSRWPFGEWSIDRSAGGHLPVIVADICPGAPATDEANAEARGACLRLVGLHAARPLEGEAKPQDVQLRRAAQFAAAAPDGRVVLLGDLNLTPWSPRFRTLLAEAGLRDAGLEQPLAITWRSPVPLVGLPIDHVLTGPGFTVTCARTGLEVGSDHLPVIADVAPVAPSAGEDAERLALTR